ncbi:MAG: hypothetical protein HY699_13345 [Deltaproteobacteria bacterium]|nr:hypothetical protein [Deltaproteobacteria bacterium]
MEAATATETWSTPAAATSAERTIPKLAEPEVLMPSQYLDLLRGHSPYEGEKRLMLAVLEDAISCFQKYAGASKGRRHRLFNEAQDWLLDTDGSWPFSFEGICQTLDLNPDYLRDGLMRWKDRFLARPDAAVARVARVRLRAARRHKILPFVPRRRHKAQKTEQVAAVA